MEIIKLNDWQTIWAHNKYWIMAHSQQKYNQIRMMARENNWDESKTLILLHMIQEVNTEEPTTKTLTTAYQHVWGYFKKECSPEEKCIYLQLLSELTPQNDHLGPFLRHLSVKYDEKYLLNSKLIQSQPPYKK